MINLTKFPKSLSDNYLSEKLFFLPGGARTFMGTRDLRGLASPVSPGDAGWRGWSPQVAPFP